MSRCYAGYDEYGLRHLSRHLLHAKRWQMLERVLTDLEFLHAKCAKWMAYELIADYNLAQEALPLDAQSELKEFHEFLRRYAHHLVEYPEVLFSLAYNEGSRSVQQRALQLANTGAWHDPWFKLEKQWCPNHAGVDELEAPDAVEIVSQIELRKHGIWGLIPKGHIAFVTQELGKIGIVDLARGRILPESIEMPGSSILRLVASADGQFLAAARDGEIDILHITHDDYGDTTQYTGHGIAAPIRYLVPEYEAPVLAFVGPRLWYQDEVGQIAAFDLLNLAPVEMGNALPHLPSGAEISGIVVIGDMMAFAWRIGRDTELCVVRSGQYPQIEQISGADVAAICSCGENRVALALTNYRIVVYEVGPQIELRATTRIEGLPSALLYNDNGSGELQWFVPSAHVYTWRIGNEQSPAQLNMPDRSTSFSGIVEAVVGVDGTWQVATHGGLLNVRRGLANERNKILTRSEFRQVFAANEGYVAIQRACDKFWFVNSKNQRAVEIPSGLPHCITAYDPGAGVLLGLKPHAPGFLIDQGSETICQIPDLPGDVCAVTADRGGVFWIADHASNVFSFDNRQTVTRVASHAAFEVRDLRCWLGNNSDWLTWSGITLVSDQYPAGTLVVFFQIHRSKTDTKLVSMGERLFPAADGYLETHTYLPAHDEFLFKFIFKTRIGSAQDFIACREREMPLDLVGRSATTSTPGRQHLVPCSGAVALPDKQGVYLLTQGGELLLIDSTSGRRRAIYAGSAPIDRVSNQCLGDRLYLVLGNSQVFGCTFQEAK